MDFFSNLSATVLIGLITGAVSVAFSYIPFLYNWYSPLAAGTKKLIMAALILVSALVIFGLDCANLLNTSLTCTASDLNDIVYAVMFGAATNQAIYSLTKPTTTEGVG